MNKVKEIKKAIESFYRVLNSFFKIACSLLIFAMGITILYESWLNTNIFLFWVVIMFSVMPVTIYLSFQGNNVRDYKINLQNQKDLQDSLMRELTEIQGFMIFLDSQSVAAVIVDAPEAKLIKKRFAEKIIRLEKKIKDNSPKIEIPKFIIFWEKHILSLRMPKLNLASF